MIIGVVQGREGRISLIVRGSRDHVEEIEVVVDTGYTAFLSLPPSCIAALALRWKGIGRCVLADGSECLFNVYEGQVEWDGTVRRLRIDEADTDALAGMALLSGYELRMQIRDGGKLTIKRLPRR